MAPDASLTGVLLAVDNNHIGECGRCRNVFFKNVFSLAQAILSQESSTAPSRGFWGRRGSKVAG
jgi:hypothetical protein